MFSLETVKDLQHLLRSMGPWAPLTAWTPKLRATTIDPDLGNGSASGQYSVIGGWCFGWARIHVGSSGSSPGSGTYYVEPPVPPHPDLPSSNTFGAQPQVGQGHARDNSNTANNITDVAVVLNADDVFNFHVGNPNNTTIGSSDNYLTAANDRLSFQFAYPVDPDWTP